MDIQTLKRQIEVMNKNKICVWGTGNMANAFAYHRFTYIDDFIDNDSTQTGKGFYDKRVLHPSQVTNWNHLFIIIAALSKEKIAQQLQSYGLTYGHDFLNYDDLLEPMEVAVIEEQMARNINSIRNRFVKEGSTIVFNDHALNDKVENTYYREWIPKLKDESFLFIHELGGKTKYSLDGVPILELPEALVRNLYPGNTKSCVVKDEILRAVKQKSYMDEAARHLRYKNKWLQPAGEYLIIFYFDKYIRSLFEMVRPKRVIVRTSFDAYHAMLIEICHELKIEVIHTEFGVLSGTIVFEKGGEMGESYPTLYSEKFAQLPITREEYNIAGTVWSYLQISGLNRNKQDKNGFEEKIIGRINKERPTVFYAGQADWGSGIQPYTNRTRQYHSPVFSSSIQAAIYLSKLCEKNNWNYIYKPHPRMYYEEGENDLSPITIRGDGIGINYLIDSSDVVITILSQTAYIALLRKKPTVLLGYMQLKSKGCAYEAYSENNIEKVIMSAIKDGFSKQQQEAFQKHVAQVLKYYVYDDGAERKLRFGKEMPSSFDEIDVLPNILKNKEI